MNRAIVCGGRSFVPRDGDAARLRKLLAALDIIEVVHGGASGADTWAAGVAARDGYPTRAFPADWEAHGKKAGPLRNATMAGYVRNNGGGWCIAFPGGPGTADMLRQAKVQSLGIIDLRDLGILRAEETTND